MATLEELKKRLEEANFNMNRAAEMPAGGKFGAPGIGGEEVLYSLIPALAPAGILGASRAASAGVRGFNTAAQKLEPVAEAFSGFVTSPVGQQYLGNLSKTLLFNKLAKEIDRRYGDTSMPWFRREGKRLQKGREESAAKHKVFDEEKEKILRDLRDSMPHYREKSQKVVNIGMGSTIRTIRQQQAQERKRKEWALTILDQFKAQGASKKQIDDFIEHSGVAFNPDRESRFLHPAVLGVKEVEQYYPNPEKAEVKELPFEHGVSSAMRVMQRLRRDGPIWTEEGRVASLAEEQDSQELFRRDPEKWLWSLGSEDVLGGESIDPTMLTSALNAQGINPHAFRRFHYLGVDDPDNPIVPDEVYENYWSDTFDVDPKDTGDDQLSKDVKEDMDYLLSQSGKTRVIKGPLGKDRAPSAGQRAEWVKQLNALIAGKESGQYPESLMKVFDEAIKKSREIISGFDELFGYNADEDRLERESNLNTDEFKMLQDIKSKPEGQRLPFEKEALLKLESRNRWGREFELWTNMDWPDG